MHRGGARARDVVAATAARGGYTCPLCGAPSLTFDGQLLHVVLDAAHCRERAARWAAWDGCMYWNVERLVLLGVALGAGGGVAQATLARDVRELSREPPGSHLGVHLLVDDRGRAAAARLAPRAALLDALVADCAPSLRPPSRLCARLRDAPATFVLLLVDTLQPRARAGGARTAVSRAREFGLVPWEALEYHGERAYVEEAGLGDLRDAYAAHWSTCCEPPPPRGEEPPPTGEALRTPPPPRVDRALACSGDAVDRAVGAVRTACAARRLPRDGFHFGGVEHDVGETGELGAAALDALDARMRALAVGGH